MKKLLCVVMAILMSALFCVSAFADADPVNGGVIEQEYLTDLSQERNIEPRGARPPESNSVWDRGKGDYSASFTIESRVFTKYMFTGYSSYTISASATSENTHNKAITLAVYTNGKLTETHKGPDGEVDDIQIHVDAGDKIYVAVSRDYDGFTASGYVHVRHG